MTQLSAGDTAVVTGAAAGIGAALAGALARRGVTVVLADVHAEAMTAVVTRIVAEGGNAVPVVTDVADPESVYELATTAFGRFGTVELVCFNAGILGPPADPVWSADPEAWWRVFSVNVLGAVNCVRAFLPRLVSQGRRSHVVATASLAAVSYSPVLAPYNASKAALLALFETLSHQLADVDADIGVSVLLPGATRTDMVQTERAAQACLGSADGFDNLQQRSVGTELILQNPAEVADRVLNAVEQDADYVFPHPTSRQRIERRVYNILSYL